MTNEEINREIEIADITLRIINSFSNPIWLQDDSTVNFVGGDA